eukprot:snap_masked-scaffold575_size133042-processed-gene-0.15 protein:Tk10162 transcript:snap_masked-scaffold575_size133042-processed-gene-0.15-mRNA-1 annotation:"hypothetical protein EAG_02403"
MGNLNMLSKVLGYSWWLAAILSHPSLLPNGRTSQVQALPDIIKIGGLFDLAESKQEVAFRYAVERVNANRKILSNSLLSAQLEKIPPQDSFHASKRGEV